MTLYPFIDAFEGLLVDPLFCPYYHMHFHTCLPSPYYFLDLGSFSIQPLIVFMPLSHFYAMFGLFYRDLYGSLCDFCNPWVQFRSLVFQYALSLNLGFFFLRFILAFLESHLFNVFGGAFQFFREPLVYFFQRFIRFLHKCIFLIFIGSFRFILQLLD